MDIDGKNNICLTNSSYRKYDLKFLPKGDYVFFQSEQLSSPYVIYKSWLLNINTQQLTQLDNKNNNYTDFSISPDQTKILYVGAKERSANEPIDIYVMNWNMDKSKKITNGGINYNPIFNNDGTKIVYRHMNDWNEKYEIRLKEDKNGNWGL